MKRRCALIVAPDRLGQGHEDPVQTVHIPKLTRSPRHSLLRNRCKATFTVSVSGDLLDLTL